jgi:hypothetical protein
VRQSIDKENTWGNNSKRRASAFNSEARNDYREKKTSKPQKKKQKNELNGTQKSKFNLLLEATV